MGDSISVFSVHFPLAKFYIAVVFSSWCRSHPAPLAYPNGCRPCAIRRRARAQELYYDKKFFDAEVELSKVLARNPTDKVAWHFLVQAAQCLKDGGSGNMDRGHCNHNKMTEDLGDPGRMVSASSKWSIKP
jgi:hypothetical protein